MDVPARAQVLSLLRTLASYLTKGVINTPSFAIFFAFATKKQRDKLVKSLAGKVAEANGIRLEKLVMDKEEAADPDWADKSTGITDATLGAQLRAELQRVVGNGVECGGGRRRDVWSVRGRTVTRFQAAGRKGFVPARQVEKVVGGVWVWRTEWAEGD